MLAQMEEQTEKPMEPKLNKVQRVQMNKTHPAKEGKTWKKDREEA